jgi:hypothetical protein
MKPLQCRRMVHAIMQACSIPCSAATRLSYVAADEPPRKSSTSDAATAATLPLDRCAHRAHTLYKVTSAVDSCHLKHLAAIAYTAAYPGRSTFQPVTMLLFFSYTCRQFKVPVDIRNDSDSTCIP